MKTRLKQAAETYKIIGFSEFLAKQSLYSTYGLYCFAFFGHKATRQQKNKMRYINNIVNNVYS